MPPLNEIYDVARDDAFLVRRDHQRRHRRTRRETDAQPRESADDPFATPAETGSGDELNALCWSSDEMTALSTPRIGDSAPTICDTTLAFPRRQTAPSPPERRRVGWAIAAAIGLVGGLGAIMYLLSLHL